MNPGPVLINGLVPDCVVSRGADGRPEVGMGLEDLKILPVRDVRSQPIPKHIRRTVKISKIGGHEDTFLRVKGESGIGLGFIKDGLAEPKKSKASQGSPNIISAPPKGHEGGAVLGPILGLERLELLKKGISCHCEHHACGGAPLDNTS